MEQFMNLLLNTVKIIRILCQLFAIFFFDQLNFAPIIFQFFLIPFRIFKTNKQKTVVEWMEVRRDLLAEFFTMVW